jgi:hypothetical protein
VRPPLEGFEKQEYIEKIVEGVVHFEDRGRRHHDLYRHIRVEDVGWTSELLAKLTPKQWQDAFRAAHYDQETAARYIGRILQKVEEGRLWLAGIPSSSFGRPYATLPPSFPGVPAGSLFGIRLGPVFS